MSRLLRITMIAALCAIAGPGPATPPPDRGEALMEYDLTLAGKPPFRRLFLDAMVTEESGGLERIFHAPVKYEKNPIMKGDAPWEGWGPNLGGTVIRDGGKLRMYYYCIADGEPTKVCMAESKDGLNWTRPKLGLVEWKESKDNNILKSSTLVYRANKPASPDRKWVMYSQSKGHGNMGFSADGLTWTRPPELQDLFSTSDVVNFFFDPYRNRMCATWKTSNRRHRAVGVVLSDDGLTWKKPVEGPIFVADDLDPDATQIYGMHVFAYQKMFIGMPLVYHARWLKYGRYTKPEVMFEAQEGSPCTGDIQLAWSWDLINWTRTPKREPFIANSPINAFDYGFIGTAREPLVMGDELWFYYSGWDQVHEDYKGLKAAVGLAKLRLDGFCSMQASETEGWLISRREVFNTPEVTVNAKCGPGGYVTAEIVDRNNNVIKGFEKNYCNAFQGDSVRGKLTWKTKEFPEGLRDKDRKIRFYIKNADLYSYLPVGINEEIDDSWPD